MSLGRGTAGENVDHARQEDLTAANCRLEGFRMTGTMGEVARRIRRIRKKE